MRFAVPGDPTIPDEVAREARQLGPLESPLIWATFTAVAVACVVLAIVFRRRTRVRRRVVVVAVCCALLAGVTGLNSYVGYVRTVHDLGRLLARGGGPARALGGLLGGGEPAPTRSRPWRDHLPAGPDAGSVELVDLPDPALAVPSGRSYVLLPPGYADPVNAGRRYPVVYLIHGYPYGGPEDWLTAGDALTTLRLLYHHRALAPTIVVSVDLTAGQPSRDWEGLDVPGGPRLETYLTRTVVDQIDHRYRTVADRAHRALGGMSGGAFAALNVGLHQVGRFGVLLLTLPYDTLGDDAGLLGTDRKLLAANTPRDYLPTMKFTGPVAVLLTGGSGAPADVTTAQRIAAALRARGQIAVVHIGHGFNHTWHTARATLPYLLVFADQAFGGKPG
ncbi:esterase family protein [Amycolatopsis sp. GM8]|uniref:alpha/beta hydrolase n=1 Tax=Amycolatopsis sp. GM8 TaxID=2896530 RepID=UPI001EEF6183|nr:alpha/beta hydrolase-fold protein [Amycolatopsis sp. GM8]